MDHKLMVVTRVACEMMWPLFSTGISDNIGSAGYFQFCSPRDSLRQSVDGFSVNIGSWLEVLDNFGHFRILALKCYNDNVFSVIEFE